MYYRDRFEAEFQTLQTEVVEEYEAELEEGRGRRKEREQVARRDENQTREILRQAEIDLEHLEQISAEEAEAARKRHDTFRADAVERDAVEVSTVTSPGSEAGIVRDAGGTVINPYATTLLVPDMALMEGIEGEKGNPWIRPHDPSKMNLSNSAPGGGGWGCGAYGGLSPTTGYVWYHFKPHSNGSWQVKPRIDFSGFYRYYANDKWYNCKSASVRFDVDIFVHQYGSWRSDRKEYRLFKKGGGNVDNYGTLDNAYAFPLILQLRADWCWVLARLTLDADARGDGSWAELNFKSGSANFINPWHMVATKL